MSIVVDANLIVVLALNDPRAVVVGNRLSVGLEGGESLHAPTLLPYEVANGLTRIRAAGLLSGDELEDAWELARQFPLQLHPIASGLDVINVALRLRRSSAYDAAYIVLAQQLGAELWTLDGPLARNAAGLGFPVRLVG